MEMIDAVGGRAEVPSTHPQQVRDRAHCPIQHRRPRCPADAVLPSHQRGKLSTTKRRDPTRTEAADMP